MSREGQSLRPAGSEEIQDGEMWDGVLESFAPPRPPWNIEIPQRKKDAPSGVTFVAIAVGLLGIGLAYLIQWKREPRS